MASKIREEDLKKAGFTLVLAAYRAWPHPGVVQSDQPAFLAVVFRPWSAQRTTGFEPLDWTFASWPWPYARG